MSSSNTPPPHSPSTTIHPPRSPLPRPHPPPLKCQQTLQSALIMRLQGQFKENSPWRAQQKARMEMFNYFELVDIHQMPTQNKTCAYVPLYILYLCVFVVISSSDI
ncbi:unnamed protein product [Rodentolepis nana]|uniref:XRN2-binding (XTBD) domain-containing protein n=1 Tax=Rodentolepis nana TaxID=102285 RepID=A0A0R3TJA4_RODNA|nr:unnamed protein product [Rodentolepis nana]